MLAVSVDSPPANARFAKDIGVTFPLLSDMKREVAARYGVLDPDMQVAKRVTFVIDRKGVIQHIESGRDAIDPGSEIGFCSRM